MQTSVVLRQVFAELDLQLIKEVIFNTEGNPIKAVEMMRVSEYLSSHNNCTCMLYMYVVHICCPYYAQVYLLSVIVIHRTLLPGLFF